MNLKDLYIDFFISKNHKLIPSAPVVPENDPTVLRCANNIEKVTVAEVNLLNVCDVVENKNIIITVDAIKKIEEAYV